MGLDLTIAPFKNGNEKRMLANDSIIDSIIAYSRMAFRCNYELFAYFREMGNEFQTRPVIETKELNKPIDWYFDEGIESIDENKYGEKLTYCLAKEFNKIDIKKLDTGEWNKAIIQMVRALPEDTPIILYWW